MSEVKPFASLSSSLLARKGQAKPAMKPQGYTLMPGNLEDLGWNDMGYAQPRPLAAEPTPEIVPPVPAPPVVQQQAEIETKLSAFMAPQPDAAPEPASEPVPEPAAQPVSITAVKPVRTKPKAVPVVAARATAKAKAAFTLRLDAPRHLRLRLACAIDHRSAQQIVTAALDAYLDTLPELDAVAAAAARSA